MQSAIGARVFRAILPGRIFILSSSKALQVPCAVLHASKAFYPAETSFYVAEVFSRSVWSSPCCRKLHRIRNLNRISTCNPNTSTKVSGLQIHYLFLCLQYFYIFFRNSKKFHSILGTNSSKPSKLVFQSIQVKIVIILTNYIDNGYGYVRNRS